MRAADQTGGHIFNIQACAHHPSHAQGVHPGTGQCMQGCWVSRLQRTQAMPPLPRPQPKGLGADMPSIKGLLQLRSQAEHHWAQHTLKWARTWMEQSRSPKWTTLPCLSASTWNSMWRGFWTYLRSEGGAGEGGRGGCSVRVGTRVLQGSAAPAGCAGAPAPARALRAAHAHRSMYTAPLPNAASASLEACLSSGMMSSCLVTRRMPRPPPPAHWVEGGARAKAQGKHELAD